MPKRKSPNGKRRHKRCKGTNPSLGEDALSLVMQFLAPVELYRLAFTCKDLRDKVTVELVVRSALIDGGKPRETIKSLYELMIKRSIHPPSPLRLLRLVNVRRCEFCCKTAVRTVRPCSGVALCFQSCLLGEGFVVRHYPFESNLLDDYPGIEPTIERKQGYCYFWNKPLIQDDGEICGPFVTLLDLILAVTNPNHLEILFRNGPPEEAYQEFIRTYDDFLAKADTAKQEREERRERKKEEKERKHCEAVVKKLTKIQEQLDEPWRDYALSFHYASDAERQARKAFLVLDCAACDQVLRFYVHNPRECRAAEIRDAATQINEYFKTLEESSFLDFSFLSDTRPFERCLRQFCQAKLHDRSSLVRLPGANQLFFELLNQRQYFDALLQVYFDGGSIYKIILAVLSFQDSATVAQNLVNEKERQHNSIVLGRRQCLAAIYNSYQEDLPQLLELVSEYCGWLQSREDFDDALLDRARNFALLDSSCLSALRRKDFVELLMYGRTVAF